MSKKTKIPSKTTEEDITAFRKAVSGVKPLINKKIRLAPRLKKVLSSKVEIQTAIKFDESGAADFIRSEELILYKHLSVSNKRLRKLCKGQYNVDATLDLHGMTTEEAKKAVARFLQRALDLNQRVVLIIHGKGRHTDMPILKTKINFWLRQLSAVLAFCSAGPAHGSRGAIYVLLARHRRTELE